MSNNEQLRWAAKENITEYAAQKIEDLGIVKKLHKIVVKCAEEEQKYEWMNDSPNTDAYRSARLTALATLAAIRDGNLADIQNMQGQLSIDADGILGRDSIMAIVDFCMKQGEGFDADRFPRYSATPSESVSEKKTENLPENMSMEQFMQLVIAEVVPLYLEKLKTPEGIDLSIDNLYNDILSLIAKYEWKFGPDDPRAKVLASIRKNYFEPKDPVGKARVEYLIKNVVLQGTEKKPLSAPDLDGAFDNMIGPWLQSLVDISESLDENQIKQVFDTIASITEVRDFFRNHPDIECIAREILPQLLRSNKDTFVGSCRTFFNEIKPFILEASGSGGKLSTDARVRIVNCFSTFLKGVVRPENADALVDKLQNLETIKNNPILQDALAIVNHLDGNNKNLLIQYTLDFLAEASSKEDGSAQGDVYIQKVFVLFMGLREQIAQNPELEASIRSFLDKHISPHVQKSDIEAWIKGIEGKTHLPLSTVLKAMDYLKVNFASGVTDTILFVLKSSLLGFAQSFAENDEDLKALAAKAMKAGKQEIRSQLRNVQIEWPTETLGGGAGDQLTLLVAQNFTEKIRTLFLDTLRAGGKIKKEDFYPIIVQTLKEAIGQDRQILLGVLKEAGIDIQNANQEAILERIVNHLLASSAFMNVVTDLIESILEYRPQNTQRVASEIGDIISASLKASMTGNGPALYKIAFGDLLYGENTSGEEANNLIIATYFKNFSATQQQAVKTTISLIQKHVNKEAFDELFDTYLTLQKNGWSNSENGIALINLLLDRVDNETVIKDIIASGILAQFLDKWSGVTQENTGSSSAPALSSATLGSAIDLFYRLGTNLDSESYKNLSAQIGINSLFGDLTSLFLSHTKNKKDQVKSVLIANTSLLNELAANPDGAKQNPQIQNALLNMVEAIYSGIPQKGEFLEKLTARFAMEKHARGSSTTTKNETQEGAKVVFTLDTEKIALLGKAIYATLDEVDDARLGNIIKNILSGYGAAKIMDMSLFGKPLQSHIRFVLTELGPDGFVSFLQDNLPAINGLIGKENELLAGLEINKPDTDALLIKMASDLSKRIRPEAFKKQVGEKASRFISIFGESLQKREQKIGALLPSIRRVQERINNPKAPRPSEKDVAALGGEMFETISEAVAKMSGQDIIDLKEMVMSSAGGKAGNGENSAVVAKSFWAIFFESFKDNNRGFLIGEFISAFFSIKPEKIFVHYFADGDNKEKFIATCQEAFAKYGV